MRQFIGEPATPKSQPVPSAIAYNTETLPMANFRYRFTFGKGRELRFTGHLDLHRAWDRMLRRAQLSMAFSEGFNPRPKINLGAALPLGCTSEADLVDIETTADYPAQELLDRVNPAAPAGLSVSTCEAIEPGSPKLQKLIVAAVYTVHLRGEDRRELEGAIQETLDADQLMQERRGKEYDLRPLIEDLALEDSAVLGFQLAARSGATGRPDEMLRALGLNPDPLVPHRVRLILREPRAA